MIEKHRKTKGVPDNVDKHVGAQLRARRSFLGMSQEKLADSVGITFQQIQKYERGANRVSAGRLFGFSQTLDVPVTYFYEGVHISQAVPSLNTGMSDNDQESFEVKKSTGNYQLNRSDLEHILDLFKAIEDESKRQQFINHIKKESKKFI